MSGGEEQSAPQDAPPSLAGGGKGSAGAQGGQQPDIKRYVEAIRKLKKYVESQKKMLESQRAAIAQKDHAIERLRSTAKRGLEQSRQDIQTKDRTIAELHARLAKVESHSADPGAATADDEDDHRLQKRLAAFRRSDGEGWRRPEEIRLCVQDGGDTWCLVQLEEDPGAERAVWMREQHLESALPELYQAVQDERRGPGAAPSGGGGEEEGEGETGTAVANGGGEEEGEEEGEGIELDVPDPCLPPAAVSQLRSQVQELQSALDEARTEHREARVRMGLQLRQKENELAQLRTSSLASRVAAISDAHGGSEHTAEPAHSEGSGEGGPPLYRRRTGLDSGAGAAGASAGALMTLTTDGIILGSDGMPIRGKQALREELKKLLQAESQLREEAATWRDRAVTLESRLERAHSDREEALQSAASWRRRCEKAETEGKGNDQGAGAKEREGDRYRRLRREYKEYRRKAMEVVAEREKLVDNLKQRLEALEQGPARGGGGEVNGTTAGSALPEPSASATAGEPVGGAEDGGRGAERGAHQPREEAAAAASAHSLGLWDPAVEDEVAAHKPQQQHEYLKNVVLQYMTTEDEDLRARMESAVAAVLHFSPAECEALAEKRRNAAQGGGWLSWVGT